MKTQTQTIVNGVNVSQLFETIDNIKQNSEIAKFNFRATNKWIGGTENHTTVGDFYGACQTQKRETPHTFIKDEPELLLGKDKGANPVEYLLAARGVKINSIESTLEGDIDLQGLLQIDKSVNPGYQGINISFKIKSDASDEVLQELIELAKNVSPVANTVSKPTSINVSLA
jgi:uncharacterized OsmC-like protein